MRHIPEARVSIVIPVFNAEAFIDQTLSSVFGQTFHEFHVIAVNDGSTDASAAILRRFRDERLFVVDQHNSGGPARPRNVGIGLSSGEYVALFDADDVMKPDKLALSVSVLDNCADAGFVFSDLRIMDEHGNLRTESFLCGHTELHRLVDCFRTDQSYVYIPPEPLFDALCRENFIASTSVMVRRSVLDAIGGFDESLKNSDDRDLGFRLARKCGAAYIPRVLQYYRKWSGSVSTRGTRINAANRIAVLQRQLDIGVSVEQRGDLLKLIASNHASIGYSEREQGHRWASVRAFLDAYTATPRIRLLLAAAKSVIYPKWSV